MRDERKKIEIIQALRGIAALGIVYYHTEYGPWKSCNWGVGFFFMLSGYFAMMSTENRRGGGYWKNKLIKLLPLYYAVTIATTIGYFMVPSLFRSILVTPETFVKSVLFIPCYMRNESIFPIYGAGWTLNLEMFFYLLFYVAMRLSFAHRGHIASMCLISLVVLGQALNPEIATLKAWTTPNWIYFILGIGIYELKRRKVFSCLNANFALWTVLISLICLFSGYYLLPDERYILPWNLFWISLMIIAGVVGLKDVSCPKWLVSLGDMSYSIYLTHNFIVRPMKGFILKDTGICIESALTIILTILLVIACAKIVYVVFERRLPRAIRRMLG